MNNVKRVLALLLAVAALAAFVACAPTEDNSTPGSSQSTQSTQSTAQSTAPSTTTAPAVTYRVKVVDEEGKPVAGVGVQLCKDSCVISETNAEGWAEFTVAVEDGYHANIAFADEPEGKEVDATEYDFASGETEMTITLKFNDKT